MMNDHPPNQPPDNKGTATLQSQTGYQSETVYVKHDDKLYPCNAEKQIGCDGNDVSKIDDPDALEEEEEEE
ncbi:hypothetical protein DPMN_097572 [Dreissena polymorpha]|uniref:Uncharacterized protein n=1 Tax=Dreissena polymorpha TaxID=45954 RepID=A0A9D4LD52_DREPO|nr:hypothetical protein DPMN_097572 [Dreissena polymorpha]